MKKYLGLLVLMMFVFTSSSVSASDGKCWRIHWTIGGSSGQGEGLLSHDDAVAWVNSMNNEFGSGTHTMVNECEPTVITANDDMTNNSLSSAGPVIKSVKLGEKSENVGLIQDVLIKGGYLAKDKKTKSFGPLTKKALQKLQEENGLEQTGQIGPKTKVLLQSMMKVSGEVKGASTSSVPKNGEKRDCTKTSAPFITVNNPNGGETYQQGQQIKVTWKSCNVSPESQVNILIKQQVDGNIFLNNVLYTLNDGGESFTLPASATGDDFRIRVAGSDGLTPIFDWSDNYFKIVPQ